MGVLQTLFHQPSRSYSSVESPSKPSAGQQQAEEPKPRAASITGVIPAAAADERAARRAQYYSAAADPRLRKEWEVILANDKRPRRPVSAGALPRLSPTSASTTNSTSSKATVNNKTRDEEDSDQFFTPVSSPRTSPQTAALDLANHQARQSPVRPLGVAASPIKADLSNSMPNISSRVSTTSSIPNQSYASSVASSDDNYTNYSWAGHGTGSDYTHITIASSSRTSRHSKQRSQSGITPAAQLEPPPDWAKDIRWLTPAEDAPRYPKRAHSIASPSTASVSSFGSRPSSRASGRSGSSSGRSKTEPTRPRPKRRMSEIQEEVEEDALVSSQDEDRPIQVSPFGVLIPQRKKSNASQTRTQHKKKALSTHSEASSTTSIQTAELPLLLPHAEPGTYTSIVFPRTSYQPSKRPDRLSSSVDMVHLGVGSTTMTTISVTKGAAETLERARRFSLPGKILSPRSSSESSTPKHLTPDETTLVALTSHTPSPTKVQTNQVLVQVCCVALEGLDVFLVREKGKNSDGYGFVPGRGFCGRVIETGLSVSDFRKGDWVIGLLDLAKSGALSEFVLVDRRRIHKCPSPTPSLTAEHLAVLAVSGIAAQRAVSTIPGQIHKARVLVLQAHDGAGALASQELAAAGALVTVQVASEDLLGKLKGLKLEAVKIGTPLEVLQSLENSEEHQFDAVIDTVGGKEIWEACKHVFSSEGQFTTIVGDSLESCLSRNAHVKSNMRSLKSAFRKQENRSLQYEWVSPSAEVDHEGNDIRHSLEAACALATEGHVRPRIEERMIVPFERAPELLNSIREDGPAGYLLNGGVAVVRLQ